MTKQHPLTDKIIQAITHNIYVYDDCPPPLQDDMRAAADWQLEQVIQFMEEHEELFGGSGMIFILKDAMRPQQQENN